jgi:hypothetical protein
MKRLFTVICLLVWMPIPAIGGWFGPSNYEECILKNMKGVTSDEAARAIQGACRREFPRKTVDRQDVPVSVLEDITGDAWFIDKADPAASRTGNFYAKLYNNNAKWVIFRVKIRIIDKATGTYEDVSGVTLETYSSLELEALSSFERKCFGFFVQKVPEKWEWNIIGAKGYSKP